jgi:hypothetical protein
MLLTELIEEKKVLILITKMQPSLKNLKFSEKKTELIKMGLFQRILEEDLCD